MTTGKITHQPRTCDTGLNKSQLVNFLYEVTEILEFILLQQRRLYDSK